MKTVKDEFRLTTAENPLVVRARRRAGEASVGIRLAN